MINILSSLSGEYILARLFGIFLTFNQSFSPLNSINQVKNILKNPLQLYIH